MKIASLLAVLCLASQASAAVVWNEAVHGDLSDNNLSPTPLSFQPGSNVVSGTMGRDLPQDPVDRDIFTITISAGQAISSIDFQIFTPTNQSFFAVAPGTAINDIDPATHLSNTLVKGTGDLLDDLALCAYSGGTGLPAPLGPGTYTFWFQELSSVVTYQMAYTVVPEPGMSIACASAVSLLARRRRK